MHSIHELTKRYVKHDLPNITSGDVVAVYQRITEGDKERIQQFEGLVIAKKHGNGISGTITVRKVTDGIGVERVFPIHSPTIEKIKITKHSHKTRKSKLYYIRKKAAKEARRRLKQEVVARADEKVKIAE